MEKDSKTLRVKLKKMKENRKAKQEEILWEELYEYIRMFEPKDIFNKHLLFMHRFDRDVAYRVARQYNCRCRLYHPRLFNTIIVFYE